MANLIASDGVRGARLIAGGVLAVVISACQHYSAVPLSAEAGLGGFYRKSLGSPEVTSSLKERGLSRAESWSVPMLVAAGEVTNPALARARADYAAAKASIDVANALPPFGVALDLQKAVSNGGGDPWTYGFTVDWPIELWGKRPAKAFQASQEANVAALAISKAHWDVRSGVTNSAVELLSARERLVAVHDLSDVLSEWEAALSQSQILGETGRLEELTIARERATYERDEADAKRQVRVVEASLGKALALPLNEVSGLVLRPLPEAVPSISSLTHWERQAALRRPDVLAGLAGYAVADAGLRLEILNQYPDVRLNSGLSFDQGQTKWLLGPSLNVLPHLNRAGIAQARAKLAASRAAFQEIQTTALTDVSSAWAEYCGSLEQWEKARNLAGKSREFSKVQQELLKVGEGNRLSVLQYQFLHAQDEVTVVAARSQVWQSLAALQDAVRAPLIPNTF
ncbi:MAG: TolC family protein [Akkermansiaceae bacterium]